MSIALMESPSTAAISSSQLYFLWADHDELPAATTKSVRKSAKPIEKAANTATLPLAASHLPTQSPQAAVASTEAVTEHLTFTKDGRIAQPVRIGSVMIKLLKRYGITDEEIAEGVANYVRKHQLQQRSA